MRHINLSIKNELIKTIMNDQNIGRYYLHPHFNTKFTLSSIIDEILFILKTGISWRNLRSPINWNTIYFHHLRFVRFDIYKKTYDNILSFYLNKISFINGIIVDSSFFQNRFGKNNIARNKYFKNKNCCKISILNDLNGIPFSVISARGNLHDITIFEEHKKDINRLSDFLPNNNSIYSLADKAYSSKFINSYFSSKNIKVLIPPKKIKNKQLKIFNLKQKKIYKNRLIVEHLFKDIKRFNRVDIIYDSKHSTFLSFIYLSISSICITKINKLFGS